MSGAFPIRDGKGLERSCDSVLWAAFEVGIGVCPPCFYTFLVEMFLAAGLCDKTRRDWVGLLGGSCLTKNWNTHQIA